MLQRLRLVDLSSTNKAACLKIADSQLGDRFLTDLPQGDHTSPASTIVAMDGDETVGFASYAVKSKGFARPSNKYARVSFTGDVTAADAQGKLGHLRTVAVHQDYQGRGIGSFIVKTVECRLTVLGVEATVAFGWATAKGIHIGGILKANGYQEFDIVEDFWFQESVALKYTCANCGNPCRCRVHAFKKALDKPLI